MFEVEIDGKKVKAEISFYTAQLYESEFGRDIVKDIFGVVDGGSPVSVQNGVIAKIDFTKIEWLAVTRALWAAVKTADENVGSYNSWMRANSGINLWEAREVITAELTDCFFRTGAAEEETGAQEG